MSKRVNIPISSIIKIILFCVCLGSGAVVIVMSRRISDIIINTTVVTAKSVLPSLFPFFVLSMMMTRSLDHHCTFVPSSVEKLLKIPASASSVLISAVLGGYPVGAKCIGELYLSSQISRRDAERLLGFCSNAGPAFLFGMISGFFPERKIIWLLWLIQIFSAVMTAIAIPAEITKTDNLQVNRHAPQNAVISSSAKSICLVCCWVILFRIIVSFCKKWFLWIFPVWIQVLFTGILELTNGCCELLLIQNLRLRFIVCACMLAFGGICVVFQTAAVTEGLSPKAYMKGKLIQTSFSLLLSYFITTDHWILCASLIPFWIIILRKIQNRSRNPISVPV